jgi:predicted transcriptional regulator
LHLGTSTQHAVDSEPNPAEKESASAFYNDDLVECDSIQDEYERHTSQDAAKEWHASQDAGEKGTNANEKGKASQ